MKKIIIAILAMIGVVAGGQPGFAATSVDALIEKLVEKGTLTKSEGRELKAEVAGDEKLVQEDSFQRNLPDWVKNLKLKGDIRLRYQYESTETSVVSRNRGRTRFRLGLETKPLETVTVGAGFASGGTDPRSTNVTWENTFERPDLRLDYSYVEYQAAPWAKLVGGKILFPNYLWTTTDMLWDSDINPYGFSVHLEKPLANKVTGFINGGSWMIDEINAAKTVDPFMTYVQGGVGYKDDKFDAKLAGVFYSFNGVKGADLDNELNTNSQVGNVADAGLKHDYDSGGLSVEFGVANLLGGLPFGIDERVGVFGDYIMNPDPTTGDTGWASGMVFGNAKVAAPGSWQLKYQYVYLGKDAFPDTFPDSDRLGGRTDVKSHEVMATIGLLKNISFGVDYYTSTRIKGTKNIESVVQGDLVIKF